MCLCDCVIYFIRVFRKNGVIAGLLHKALPLLAQYWDKVNGHHPLFGANATDMAKFQCYVGLLEQENQKQNKDEKKIRNKSEKKIKIEQT